MSNKFFRARMPWEDEISNEEINLRFNIITILVYLIGIILIIQLFNLQIIQGNNYREQSNTRLSRIETVKSSRGSILDRSGNELATVKTKYDVELYKTNIENNELNNSILKLVNLLNEHEEKYIDTFPININPYEFTIDGDNLTKWKAKYKINEDASAEEAFFKFIDKYKIKTDNVKDARKIIAIRYKITITGYSTTKSIKIAENIKKETVSYLSENSSEFPGISITVNTERIYNEEVIAPHVIGYTSKINSEQYEKLKDTYANDDIIGKTGIEYVFEKYLKGQAGEKEIVMAVDGTITGEYVAKEATAGSNVVLTIDANLQKATEKALQDCIEKIRNGGFSETYDAKGGSAVVMNVNTGEVLAMASNPVYNPNWFVGGISNDNWNWINTNEAHPLLNKSIQSSYAPGSIFKMVTAIAGLETGAIVPTEKINDTGIYKKYGAEWKCWYYSSYHAGHGYQNVTQALQHSCNYFFYEVGDRIGVDSIASYARYFGLGSKTGIELLSETSGSLANTKAKQNTSLKDKNWYPGDTLSASIGQSLNDFSPIQIAKYISILANGGNKLQPTIIKTIINADGTEVPRDEIEKYVNEKLGLTKEDTDITIRQESIEIAREGMRQVTSQAGGTAYNMFKNFTIEVAGKTGSAEAGANNSTVNAWFVCFAPFDNPEVAVAVMIENGGHGNYAAEVAKNILQEYFGMNAIADNTINENTLATPLTEVIR